MPGAGVRVLVDIVVLQPRQIETTLFPSFPFARSVLHRTTLGLGYRGVLRLLVHAELGLHAGLLVKNLPDRGRFVAAMFLIGQGLKRPVEGTRKSDRDRRRFLVPHAAEGVITKRKRQEFSPLAMGDTMLCAPGPPENERRLNDMKLCRLLVLALLPVVRSLTRAGKGFGSASPIKALDSDPFCSYPVFLNSWHPVP
jgi:hypothetical protein